MKEKEQRKLETLLLRYGELTELSLAAKLGHSRRYTAALLDELARLGRVVGKARRVGDTSERVWRLPAMVQA